MFRTTDSSDENGSGTILGVAVVMALLTLCISALAEGESVMMAQQTRRAAEAGALAASDALNGFTTGFPCEAARAVITINMSKLVECRIVGFEVFIRTEAQTLGMVHFASARATNVDAAKSRE